MAGLTDALDVSLDVGELVQRAGGHTTRTVDAMVRMARSLGAEECDCAISSVNVAMTIGDGRGELLSGGRNAGHFGVDFSTLSAVRNLVTETEEQGLTADEVRSRLAGIRAAAPPYPTAIVMLALGASSAAFAALFHAPALAIGLTLLGGWAGAWTRHALVRQGLLPFVFVTAAAFVAAAIVALGGEMLEVGAGLDPALAACTLFLVPGVPLLNGTADLLTGHYLNGLVKLAMSAVIVAAAAVGLTIAIALVGVVA